MSTPEVVREAQSTEAYNPLAKQKAAAKLSRIPIKVEQGEVLKKPDWIRVKAGSPTTRFYEIKEILREHKLHTVCEEASSPNIGECYGKGTATFKIMGDKCTRRCPFCDVGHGRPDPPAKDSRLKPRIHKAKLFLTLPVKAASGRPQLICAVWPGEDKSSKSTNKTTPTSQPGKPANKSTKSAHKLGAAKLSASVLLSLLAKAKGTFSQTAPPITARLSSPAFCVWLRFSVSS